MIDDATGALTRVKTRRRRFLAVSSAALAVLGIALGVTFTADTGSASITISSGSISNASSLVFPLDGSTKGLPDSSNAYVATTGGALKYSTNGTLATSSTAGTTNTSAIKTAGAVTNPSWSVVSNAAGTVSTAGDLAVIDADTTDAGGASSVLVTMYITNLKLLQHDYSSFAFPVNVYRNGAATTSCTAGSSGSWTSVNTTYLTNTTGYVSFSLGTGTHCLYDITFDTGGAFYVVSTTNDGTTGSLGPSFFYTAQAIS